LRCWARFLAGRQLIAFFGRRHDCRSLHGIRQVGVRLALAIFRWRVCEHPPRLTCWSLPQSKAAQACACETCRQRPQRSRDNEWEKDRSGQTPLGGINHAGRCALRRSALTAAPYRSPSTSTCHLTPRRNRFRQRPVQVRTRLSAGGGRIRTSGSRSAR
jgi:hypothetical protein